MSKVSVCVIAKNEAHVIAGMLASVQELSDDLIVVDTGSTDSTAELARSSGARVEDYSWQNDFAAARNFSLTFARHPWILVIDADERLDASSIPQIQRLIQHPGKAFSLKRRHYTPNHHPLAFMTIDNSHPASAMGASGYYTTSDFRLFPNTPQVKFEGIIHESCEDSLRQLGLQLEHTELVVHHYGPMLNSSSNKDGWYLELVLEKASRDSADPRNHYQAGVELQSHDRHREAVNYFQRACNLDPNDSSNWRQLGISLFALGEHLEGLTALKTAFSLNERSSFNWIAIGEALLSLGRMDEAQGCFATVLSFDPSNYIARKNIEIIEKTKTT